MPAVFLMATSSFLSSLPHPSVIPALIRAEQMEIVRLVGPFGLCAWVRGGEEAAAISLC